MAGRSEVVLEFIGDDSKLRKTIDKVEGHVSGLTGAIGKLGKVGAGAFAFTSMANTALTLGSALVTVAPAALALPGILMGAAVASNTLKLAMSGVGDAIKGDAEAMAKLAPAAQQSVKAIQGLEGGFTKMKQAVQQEFFKGLAPEISETGRQLLALGQIALPEVAAGFNGMAKEALIAARSPFFQNSLAAVIDHTAAALGNMRGVLANVLTGFVGLAPLGSQYLPAIANWVDKITVGFADWVQSGVADGSIQTMIDGALQGFREIGHILSSLGQLASAFWTGLQSGLGATASPLAMVNEKIQIFVAALRSPEGQEALRRIGEMVRSLSEAFSAVLPPLLSIVTTIATALAPAVSGVADVVAGNGGLFAGLIAGGVIAGGAIDVVSGAVETVTGVIETAKAVQEAWNFVTGLFAAQGAIVRGATMAWTAAQWLLNVALSANPIGIIVIAIAALVAGLIYAYNNVGWFKDAVDAAFSFIVDVVLGAVDGIVAAWDDLVAFFTGGPSVIGDFINGIGAWFASLPGIVGDALATAGQAVLDWFAALPGQIAFFLGYLAGLIYVGALAAWDFLWNTLPGILANVATWLAQLPIQVGAWLVSLGATVVAGATAAWNWLVTTFNQANAQLMTWLAALPGQVGGFLASLPGIVGNAATTAWNAFLNFTISVGTSALNWIGALPGKVIGFFSNAPSWLFNAGKQILEGLWNGLKSIAQGVLNWIADIGRQIAAGFAAAVGIHSPSKVFMEHGVNIGAGLIEGLKGITPAVVTQTADMAGQVGGVPMPNLTPTGSGAGAGASQIQVSFTGNTSDALATVIMGMIRTGKIQIKAT